MSNVQCDACRGSGFNPEIKEGLKIIATMPGKHLCALVNLDALKAYVGKRLLCPECKGTGRREPEAKV